MIGTIKPKWKFDEYLGEQLKRIAFVKGGEFTLSDVKNKLNDASYLNHLYHYENPSVTWNWDSFSDRMNRHIYRVVKSLGGDRSKVKRRWSYKLSPSLFSMHSKIYNN
tara:strand:+ start:1010 stop:1333 length:324 start_codon:yes stop_codon:yes gene_type:complete